MEKGFTYYTWYPKDWQSSDTVFNLTLEQRAIYRELIDLAYLENNAINPTYSIWARRWNTSSENLVKIIGDLIEFGMVKLSGKYLVVPSCEARLLLKRTGREGGKNKGEAKGKGKGLLKGEANGLPNLTETERIKEESKYVSEVDFLCSVFQVGKIHNARSHMDATYFIEKLAELGKLEYFKKQIKAFEQITEPKYRGSFQKFIGSPTQNYEDGTWCAKTYEVTEEQKPKLTAFEQMNKFLNAVGEGEKDAD